MVQTVNQYNVTPLEQEALNVSPSDWQDARQLAAGVAEAHAVPAGAKYVNFSATDNFYVRYNAALSGTAAAVPGDVTDGTACELNPTARYLIGVAEISIISAGTPVVTMRFMR